MNSFELNLDYSLKNLEETITGLRIKGKEFNDKGQDIFYRKSDLSKIYFNKIQSTKLLLKLENITIPSECKKLYEEYINEKNKINNNVGKINYLISEREKDIIKQERDFEIVKKKYNNLKKETGILTKTIYVFITYYYNNYDPKCDYFIDTTTNFINLIRKEEYAKNILENNEYRKLLSYI